MQDFPGAKLKLRDERGVTAIVVAIVLLLLVGFSALAIDIGHLCVARAELQNAADAGALAGARFLYNDDTTVNAGANDIATTAATDNKSEGVPVELNGEDVQRGHWCLATSTFTQNEEATELPDLWNMTPEQIDNDTDFVNAVRVVTRRQGTPVASFFATVFGIQSFLVSAEAIAYRGFPGDVESGDLDQPIAICDQAITANGKVSCNIGRMLNSGSNEATHNTAGWTNYSQDPCTTANANDMDALVCSDGNGTSVSVTLGGVGATGGVQQSTFDAMRQCWIDSANSTTDEGIPNEPWNLTLPVVDCPGKNVSNCPKYMGVVEINVIWMTEAGTDPHYDNAPKEMNIPATDTSERIEWSSSAENGYDRWQSFVTKFDLQNVDNDPAPYAKKSIYFLPLCSKKTPLGGTGGKNYGILAEIPVLVQ